MTSVWMSEENITRIYLGAKKYIRTKGLTAEIFDEFAAFTVIKYIDNGFKMMSYDIVFVDFMRYEYGRIYKKENLNNKKTPVEFNEEIHHQETTAHELEDSITNSLTIEKMYEKLEEREKKIVALLTYGFSQVDIANKLNISESRVSQLIKVIIKKMSHHLRHKR